jgi:hypothetical protein
MSKPAKPPKVTFVGGKWYNEHGQEVSKPAPKVPLPPLQRHGDDAVLERLADCTCARPQVTGHVPGCIHFADALYVCEGAGRETLAKLAQLAGTTISDLERRRLDYLQPPKTCPAQIPQTDGRRRCIMCPYWTDHPTETPFDHQRLED